MNIQLFTIGFTAKHAERFFAALAAAGVQRVIDVRLNNTSQLAGFSKREDLRYFLRELVGIDYVHLPELAPTQAMLDKYREGVGGWPAFEREFNTLIAAREIENVLSPQSAHLGCLLCSEHSPSHCHRRLVAEFLQRRWRDVSLRHLE